MGASRTLLLVPRDLPVLRALGAFHGLVLPAHPTWLSWPRLLLQRVAEGAVVRAFSRDVLSPMDQRVLLMPIVD